MSIKPIAFFIESSTKIVLKFNKSVYSADKQSFKISSITGNNELVSVKSIEISGDVIYINTSQQKPGYYYSMVISDDGLLIANDGSFVIDEKIQRTIFFSGFERFNPVRDNVLSRLPRIFLNEKSMIKDIISEQSEDIYRARRSAGELLADNYIREVVVDEPRTRGTSPFDRLANENCFKINRVSRFEEQSSIKLKTISYDGAIIDRRDKIDSTISLQELEVTDKIFLKDIKNYTVELSQNIIKLIEATAFSVSNTASYFDLNSKYSIKETKYDKNYALPMRSLSENQMVLEKGFVDSFSGQNDYIIIRYLTKDMEVYPLPGLSFYQVRTSKNEVLKIKTNNFNLINNSICGLNGEEISSEGFTFLDPLTGEKSKDFLEEIPYGSAYPSKPGQFSVNYAVGEVFVYGAKGNGLEFPVLASYNYKRFLKEGVDFYIDGSDLSINTSRILNNDFGVIKLSYDKVFAEGFHYKAHSHNEVMPELVGGNFTSNFSFKTSKYPITNVFRIVNKTTNEVYSSVSFDNDEVFFSADRTPEFATVTEYCKFKTANEKLYVSEIIYSNISDIVVGSFGSSSVTLSNSISDYFISSDTTYYATDGIKRIKISSFRIENNQIKEIFFESGIPLKRSGYWISAKILKFNLSDEIILDNNLENVGSALGSSLKLTSNIFKKQKVSKNYNLSDEDSTKSEFLFSSKDVTKSGEYVVDYVSGDIYLCFGDESSDFGYASYAHSEFNTMFSNHISMSECKYSSGYEISRHTKTDDGFKLKNPIVGIDYFDKKKYYNYEESNFPLQVKEDYTLTTFSSAASIYGVFKYDDVFGYGSISDGKDFYPQPENIYEKSVGFSYDSSSGIIDLKTKEDVVFYKNGDFLEYEIKSANFLSFYSLVGGGVTISSDRVLTKSELLYSKISSAGGITKIFVADTNIISSINTSYDKVNVSGSLYEIVSMSSVEGTISISTNDTISGSIFLSQIVLIENGIIKIHKSGLLSEKAKYSLLLVETSTPEPGSAMAIHFGSGRIRSEYLYLKDLVHVYYEYGDNEIEWTSNGLLSGESYYVSYEYGALRTALKLNFGLLTNIDFFKKFSLGVNREIYRDALEGSFQAFSKGSTKEAISMAVESLAKTTPDIEEGSPKGWILGRDTVASGSFKYGQKMSWGPVKYSSGTFFDNNFLSFPAKDKLSVDEGTISFWCKNDWGKIQNDADISVAVELFVPTEYYYTPNKNKFNILGPTQSHGVEFLEDIYIEKSMSGIRYKMTTSSPIDKTDISFKLSVDIKENITSDKFVSISVGGGDLTPQIEFGIKRVRSFPYKKAERDFVSSYSIKEFYKHTEFSGTYKSIAADETVIKITTHNNQTDIDYKNAYLLTGEGLLLEIFYAEGNHVYAKQKPLNWMGARYDESISTFDISSLTLCNLGAFCNSDYIGSINFLSERINISVDRNNNKIKINGMDSVYHSSGQNKSEEIILSSNIDGKIAISRIGINNYPYFNEKNIFIGKNAVNPKFAKFNIKDEGVGIPTILSPGVYLYKQTNEDFDYDNRSENYWVVEIVSVASITSVVGSVGGEPVMSTYSYRIPISVDIKSESGIYSLDQAGSTLIESKQYKLRDSGLYQVEDVFSDLQNTFVISAETTKYSASLSKTVTISDGLISATNSDVDTIFYGFQLPEFSHTSEVAMSISLGSIDYDYAQFYNVVGGYKILSSIFEISNIGFFANVLLSEGKIIVVDKNHTVLGEVIATSLNLKLNLKFDYKNKICFFSVNSKEIELPIGDVGANCELKFKLNDSEIMSGAYKSYYPETKLIINSFDIIIQNDPSVIYDKDIEVSGFGNSVLISVISKSDEGYGYGYGYDYGYGYGTINSRKAYFIAEKPKFFFDTDNNSMSLFRDYDGFLKFKTKTANGENVLSSEFSNGQKDSETHIAVSWKNDELFGSEMHMFINGEEAPNINRFMDNSNKIQKIGSVSKEYLLDGLIKGITFSEQKSCRTVISTDKIIFDDHIPYVGQILTVPSESPSFGGVSFVVYDVDQSGASVLSADSFEKFIFNASVNIFLVPAPIAYPRNEIPYNKIGVFVDGLEVATRVFDSSAGKIISTDNIDLVKAFLDTNKNSIQFVGKQNGYFGNSIDRSSEVYLSTFGLFSEKISQKISFSQNSLKSPKYSSLFENISSLRTDLPRPMSLGEVSIRKVILDKTIPSFSSIAQGGAEVFSGYYDINSETSTANDRNIDFYFESDNLLDGYSCEITVFGISNTQVTSEKLSLYKGGKYTLSGRYSKINRMEFRMVGKHSGYEPFVFWMEESEAITSEPDVFIYRFSNGEFFISSSETYYSSKVITKGTYIFSYRTKMNFSEIIPPNNIFIGTNNNKSFQCKSYIEEFKISQNMYGQTRPNNFDSNNFFDVSSEYLSTKPTCPTNTTLFLCSMNDPREIQAERLRDFEFLDYYTNSKYKLSDNQISELYDYLNEEALFVQKMMSFGFSDEESRVIYIQCHKYSNSPFEDISSYHKALNHDVAYKSHSGPSELFSGSGLISEGLVFLNDKNAINNERFCIEGWFSPSFDTINHSKEFTIFENSNIVKKTIKSSDFNTVILPNQASRVVSVKLSSSVGSSSISDTILKDEKFGKMVGFSGFNRNIGFYLAQDDVTITTKEALPGKNTFVDVYYYTKAAKESSLRLFVDEGSNIRLNSTSEGKKYEIIKHFDVSANSWNRFVINYDGKDLYLLINGKESGKMSGISIKRSPIMFSFGSGIDHSNSSRIRLSNLKISAKNNSYSKDIDGKFIDYQFKSMIPSYKDENTSFILDFDDLKKSSDSFAEITNVRNSIFRFEVKVFDNFDIIKNNSLKKLLNNIVYNIKPSHTKSIIRYENKRC